MQLTDINQYAQWVESIKYDTIEGCWVARFYPNRIAKSPNFEDIARELNKYVVNEVIDLIADVLKVTSANIKSKSQVAAYAEARHVTAAVLRRRFNVTLNCVSDTLGYNTHVALYNAIENTKTRPNTRAKLQKVYRRYPWLYRRSETIK